MTDRRVASRRQLAFSILLAGLLLGTSVRTASPLRADGIVGNEAIEAPRPTPTRTPPGKSSDTPTTPTAEPRTVEALADAVRKSVVVVTTESRNGRQHGLGSGFIISEDGLIATNLHVIGEARPISVEMADGKKYPVVEIHATERASDLAIIRIRASKLPALELGDSDTLKQGQQIVAVGNPRGLKFSIVAGVVSGRREIEKLPMIQLAIPIESGNSGGPMLDMYGRVHGLLTLKSLVSQNLGFAVPSNALKPLLQRPNRVPMSRWLTLGKLDASEWTPLGGEWRKRSGRISVASGGEERFGGRGLCLSSKKVPAGPYEVGVSVRLTSGEEGAAGLVFGADGNDRHYGFYPSNGRVRLSRFDGPDVLQWQVLREVPAPSYRAGEWNWLKVRVDKGRIQCFVNDALIIEERDGTYSEGQVGLAKFRTTSAEFRGFQVGKSLAPMSPPKELIVQIADLVREIPIVRPPSQPLIDAIPKQKQAAEALLQRARLLERQAERLRQLAKAVHHQQVRNDLAKLLDRSDDKIDLTRAALLIARHENEELDVASYVGEIDQIATEIRRKLPTKADEAARLKQLNEHLFDSLGYHGSRTEYYSKSNSFLNEVLDDREGLPITLSLLYIEVGRRLGLKIAGVGLPGHFVVRHEPTQGESQLIDPFDKGKKISREEAAEIVRSHSGVPLAQEHLAAQSKKEILVRLLRNLMGLARDGNDAEAMLRYVELVLVVQPDSPQDRWFRAVLRFQTQRIDEAIVDCEWLLENRSKDVELARVRQLKGILDEMKSKEMP